MDRKTYEETIHEAVKTAVRHAGGTPEALAAELGRSFGAVYAWWKGTAIPTRPNRELLAAKAREKLWPKEIAAAMELVPPPKPDPAAAPDAAH